MAHKNRISTLNIFLEIMLVLAIALLLSQAKASVSNDADSNSVSNSSDASSASNAAPIKCFACGLEEVNPELDGQMYGDFRREGVKQAEAKDGITRMMYNHTCDIADEMGIDDRWLRTCPPGVRSCFWAEARYDKQVPLFRGCANATFAHDQRCSRELQAVQIIWGKKTVDVEIKLCFCNDDKCNEQANGAFGLIHQQSLQFIFVAIITLIGSLLMNESMLLNEKYYTGRIE